VYEVKSFDAIQVGDRVRVSKTITEADAALYSAATGAFGPVHVDEGYAKKTRFGTRIASGLMVATTCTAVLTSHLVGIAPVSIEDTFRFTGPVFFGDTVTIEVWVAEVDRERRTIVWEASARTQAGTEVLQARATLKYPKNPPPSPYDDFAPA
jgi:3-hydroxybutyryl-CoA dehydratase